MSASHTPVLVVGAGLAGCVLALELAHHGVASIVVERSSRPPRHPEPNLVTGRGMELLRRLGLAESVRAVGADPDTPARVVWSRAIGEEPVLVNSLPSANELRRQYAGSGAGDAPAEPYVLLTGAGLTTRLRAAVRGNPLIELREGWTFTDLRLDADRTVATVLDGAARVRHEIHAGYLAGCDGAQSTVRRCLGVPLRDAITPARHCTVSFRSDTLRPPHPALSTITADGMALIRRDGHDLWIGHLPLDSDDADLTNPAALLSRRLGTRAYEIVGVTPWQEALGVAGTYRRGTAYLVGESAHRFHPPSATVDTCLADAVDLGWKLAAAVRRWGGPHLLGSYEGERRRQAMLERETLSRSIEARLRFGRLAAAGASHDRLATLVLRQPPAVDPAGATASRHDTSPVIWHDGPEPAGTRLPAVRTTGGHHLFDLLGPQFTLIDLTSGHDGRSLVAAAVARGIPVAHLPVDDDALRADWRSRLVLVRPDHYVSWRSPRSPADWDAVLDVVTGHRAQDHVST
ncbi:putative monooxygenase [Paractinoplanes abujensis]|uniref:2-polyprenyl-6-methoxyphenol hydroxylase-like FAD-dependent oxidoreductase n=1 Tax=Paractinoplanes abujensis TaxID=882441 RepID=A0A7W7G0V6_9ACTN|nr:FAD-dependent monooxygenase [Actinoplanes abujensis]MBB4691974.1 2-polyprenyl-6-methoxyphenol hydroxylase-like FAD-dependent oxidoreductase [Actinoplanes abujensis]GID16608.1 putative monooxygenase [Actinoplanes abujensis]